MYFRDSGVTIIDAIDPLQLLIPTPVTSNQLEDLPRDKAIIILNEVLNAASNTLKEYKDHIKVRKDQLQYIYHFLAEDILFDEFNYDFEDFKSTIILHKILEDQSIVDQIQEIDNDLISFYEGSFEE